MIFWEFIIVCIVVEKVNEWLYVRIWGFEDYVLSVIFGFDFATEKLSCHKMKF